MFSFYWPWFALLLPLPLLIWRLWPRQRRSLLLSLVLCHCAPYLPLHNRPGIGGKGQAPLWLEAQDRTPQADATRLQGFFKGQIIQYLLAHDCLDQTVVLRHQLI